MNTNTLCWHLDLLKPLTDKQLSLLLLAYKKVGNA